MISVEWILFWSGPGTTPIHSLSVPPSTYLSITEKGRQVCIRRCFLSKEIQHELGKKITQFHGQIQSQFRLDRILRPIYSTWFFDALSSSETTYWSDMFSAALLLGVKYQKVLGKKIIHSHDRQRKLLIAMINNSGTKNLQNLFTFMFGW